MGFVGWLKFIKGSPEIEGDLSVGGDLTVTGDATRTAGTLTPAAEDSNVIDVAFASGIASAEQYVAEVWDANTIVNASAFTVAETGAGAEVSPTGKGRLIFTTSAAGAATLSVTDVATGSGSTVYLVVRRLYTSGDTAVDGMPVMVELTFD